MYSIAVLMSTYNGEKYIRQQLETIIGQVGVSVDLYIRDDGSTDGTVKILTEYAIHKNIHICVGNNIGVIRSFEKLIIKAPEGYDYYAFADQDDIWYENKLYAAVTHIEEVEHVNGLKKAVLYCSNQNCVDKNGKFMYKRLPDDEKLIQPTIMDSMLDSHYCGCTMVFNDILLNEIKYTYSIAKKSLRIYHDNWIPIVAQAVGSIIYDPASYMDFRRHDSNASTPNYGKNVSFRDIVKMYKRRIKTVLNYRYYKGYTSYRARLILFCFGNCLDEEDYKNVNLLGFYTYSFKNWGYMILVNPLRKYYASSKIYTWLEFFIRIL